MTFKCQQCEAVIEVKEAISNDFKYMCKKHNPEPEEHKAGIANYQFDPRLRGSYYKSPVGYQIVSPDQEDILVPNWAKSDAKIQEVIRAAFPRFERNDKQQFQAQQWAAVVYLFWRVRYSEGDIADELKISIDDVHNILNRAKRVAAGFRADNSGRRKVKRTFKLD